MKIKYFVITAVLTAAIFCSAGFVSAQTTDNVAFIAQLQAEIQSLMQQIQAITAQQQGGQSLCYTFNTNLGFAQSGSSDVGALHAILDKQGFSYAPDTGNIYNEGTAHAIIQLQKKYGILQTGYIGLKTRAKLNALYKCGATPTPVPTPNPACTPNWQCQWGQCTNGYQSQVAVDSNNCGLPVGSASIACTALAKQCAPSTQSSINVTSPNGGETWQIGSTQTITWTTNNIPSTTEMYVTFVDKGGASYTQNTVINQGSFTITVPSVLISGGQYKIKVSTQDNKYFGLSNNYFTVVSSTPQPSITVTSTFENNTLVKGNTYNITWTASGFATSDTVGIKLYGPYTPSSNNPSSIVLTSGLPVNSDSYSWNISSDTAPGDYSVQVYGITGSNNWLTYGNSKIFTIATSSIKPTITITAPNGGTYTDGTQMTVTWNITGGNASDYKNYQVLMKSNPAQIYGSSPQANEYFVRLAPAGGDFGYASNGLNYPSFSVQLPSATKCTMPGVGGSDCSMIKPGTYYIEISVSSSTSNADVANSLVATSNAFNIVSSTSQSQPSITITSPNGGETWTQGQTHNITWQATGFSSDAQLYAKLLDYSGSNQGLIINNIPASAGSYSWTVPTNLSGNKFKFDLYQTNNAAIYSISNDYFSIVAPQ